MAALIVATVIIRAFVLAGAGWIDTRTTTGAAIPWLFVVIPALYVAVRLWRAVVRPSHTQHINRKRGHYRATRRFYPRKGGK